MLTPEHIAALQILAGRITDPINDYLLEDIARRISEAGQLTSTASYQIWRAQNLGLSQREIKKKLKQLLKVSNRELRQLLTQAAEVGYDFDIRRFPQVQAVSFSENTTLQNILQAAMKLAGEELENLAQTIGMVDPQGKALPLQEAYRACSDFAFNQVATGAADYNTALRRATKNLADKGLRTIDYESGVHTSLEAAVRRNIMGGLGLMVEQITAQTHDDLGCDGWEISAHANSAPDHEPIQGRQYPDAQYQALNNSLRRRIGTLNCGHIAFPIILGVNSPQYTPEELEQLRRDNAKGVEYDGRHYTGYEATQRQRAIERAIRRQKNRVLVCQGAGDKEGLTSAQIRLQTLRQEYKRFSSAVGLRTEDERLHVAGFGHKEASWAAVAYKRVEKAANSMYDIGSTEQNIRAYLRDEPLRERIKAGVEYPPGIVQGRQSKHLEGTKEYTEHKASLAKEGKHGPSRLTVSMEDAQALVLQYRGTGMLHRDKNGKWTNRETITMHPDTIGVAVNDRTGKEADTTTFKIHYSDKGTHIVPDYPSKKGAKARK